MARPDETCRPGRFRPLPGAGRGGVAACPAPDAANGPEAIVFHKTGVIRRLDKRLDAAGWAPDGKVTFNGVSLKSEDGQVAAAVGTDGGWPWIEIDYPVPGGALVHLWL